jgi:hypothetical protein
MISIDSILDTIKKIISDEHRFLLITMLFSGIAIAYVYNDNQNLNTKLNQHESSCQSILLKSKEYYEEQIKLNRESSQKQITQFIEKSNAERDSIYNYFYKEIRKSNSIVKRSVNNLNELKENENHNN